MNITIRTAASQDIDTLVQLLEELFSIEEDFIFNGKLQRKGLQLLLENTMSVILVAELGGSIVGMSTGQLVISTAQGGPSLLVEDVIVSKKARGRGIGKKLVDAVCRWATTFGAERFQLLADVNNHDGLRFYEHIGWSKTNLICLRKMHR